MNRLRSLLFSAALGGSLFSLSAKTPLSSPSSSLTRWVNTLIGTDWVGNVYPGASAPFGMVQLSPDNGRPGWDDAAATSAVSDSQAASEAKPEAKAASEAK